jgi:hypothetical protein
VIIDEEELALLREMKEHKKAYRAAYDKLTSQKHEMAMVQSSID